MFLAERRKVTGGKNLWRSNPQTVSRGYRNREEENGRAEEKRWAISPESKPRAGEWLGLQNPQAAGWCGPESGVGELRRVTLADHERRDSGVLSVLRELQEMDWAWDCETYGRTRGTDWGRWEENSCLTYYLWQVLHVFCHCDLHVVIWHFSSVCLTASTGFSLKPTFYLPLFFVVP